MLILAELHDFRRFQSPRALMSFLGLVPGEDSSGDKHRRGRITKTGNTLAYRLIIWTLMETCGVPQRAWPAVGFATASDGLGTTRAILWENGRRSIS
jgi:transposase